MSGSVMLVAVCRMADTRALPLASIAFPDIDPVMFSIGPLALRWYGLAYVLGFCGAAYVFYRLSQRWDVGLGVDDTVDVVLACVVGVVVGSRLFYVLAYGAGHYWSRPLEVFALWDGGMSWHGGFIGIVIAGLVYARVRGVRFLVLADMAAVGAPIGFFCGRIANFINGELWGRPTELPWGVVFDGAAGPFARHPSQLYEALLEGLVIFAVLLWLSRTRRPEGFVFGVFMLLYGVFRLLVEFVREPDAQIGFMFGRVTMGQVLSAPLVVVGAWLVYRALRSGREAREAPDEPESEPGQLDVL